ncbi:MAG: LytTR family transcriptional regulator [Sphingopyxis sp.]|nr:LytTR family transcriptional regulator [Sphingopyxis sp.]
MAQQHAPPTRRAAADFSGHRKGFVVALIAAPVLTLMAPFGTDQVALVTRFFYWTGMMLTGATIGFGVSVAMHSWGGLARWPLAEGAAIALGIALPLTFIVVYANAVTFGTPIPSLSALGLIIGMVALVSGVMTAINYAVTGRAQSAAIDAQSLPPPPADAAPPQLTGNAAAAAADIAPQPAMDSQAHRVSEPAPSAPTPRFAHRLPLAQARATIIALEAEDHYLRVHTDAGAPLILMRLSDAVAEIAADLGTDAGVQTHRSWWVARDAVVGVTRKNGRAELTLSNGSIAPVSRAQMAAARAMGWLR